MNLVSKYPLIVAYALFLNSAKYHWDNNTEYKHIQD